MAQTFRIAFSGDFRTPDGGFAYPMIDLSALSTNPRIETGFVATELADRLTAQRFDLLGDQRAGNLDFRPLE